MKIVVTGALGHIGSRVIREFPSAFPGAEIVMVDNLLVQRYCSLFNLPGEGNYRFIEADVLSADMRAIVAGADFVLHLAAITDAAGSVRHREQVEHVNLNATIKVAEACMSAGCPMIHMSSTSVYGTQGETVDEDCPEKDLKPQSPYAETKLREERYLVSQSAAGGLRFVSCRFGTIAGVSPGMRFHTAVNKFCWQAATGQPLTVWRTALHQKRPYLDLHDAVEAYKFIVRRNLFDGRIYNVLTANLTVDTVVGWIREHVPGLRVEFVDTAIMNQLSYEVSSRRFQDLGFVFTGSIEKSIAETLRLLRHRRGDNRDR